MNTVTAAFASLPMGDDFPTGILIVVIAVAAVLCIGCMVLGRNSRKK